MRSTPQTTALRLATLLARSGKTRGRFSEKTIRLVAGRAQLRQVFLNQVSDELDDLGYGFTPLRRPGYGIFSYHALESSPVLLVKHHPGFRKLSDDDMLRELGLTDEGDNEAENDNSEE